MDSTTECKLWSLLFQKRSRAFSHPKKKLQGTSIIIYQWKPRSPSSAWKAVGLVFGT